MSKSTNDKVVITIEIQRNENGTAERKFKVEGEGFRFFEMIGILECCKMDLLQKSMETAKELPEGPTRMVYPKQA